MGTISRFEDIEAWADARLLVAEVYKESKTGSWGTKNAAVYDLKHVLPDDQVDARL